MLVVDYSANNVLHIGTDGKLIDTWGMGGAGDGQFARAAGIAVGPDGSIYVADHDNQRIQKFDSAGKFLLAWGSLGTNPGQFGGPDGIAVGPDGLVYVSEARPPRVQSFSAAGAFVQALGGTAAQSFGDPTGIEFLDGSLLIADYNANQIWIVDRNGSAVGTIGSPGDLNGISMIALDRTGDLFATDYNGGHVQEFDPQGRLIASFVLPGGARFDRPWGLAVGDDGELYVAEYGAGRVERLRIPR